MAASKGLISLPKAGLKDKDIPFEVLSLIPLSTMEKYQVAVFASEEKELKMAIVHPEQLKEGFYVALKDLGNKLGKTIQLFQTDSASMSTVIKKYKRHEKKGGEEVEESVASKPLPQPRAETIPDEPLPPLPPLPTEQPSRESRPVTEPSKEEEVPAPPLFKLGKTVAYRYLRRVPLDFAREHRICCVDFKAPNIYWFITDKEHAEANKETVKFIGERNEIIIHLMIVEPQELADLLDYYATQDKRNAHQAKEEKEEETEEPQLESAPEKPVAKGVITPQEQGGILSAEPEKGGLAGLFQKMAQNIASEKPEKEATSVESAVELKPMPAITPTSETPAPAPQPMAVPASSRPAPSQTKPRDDESDGEIGKLLNKSVDTNEELREHIRQGFIPRIVAAVVSFAIHEKASDIHIEAYADEVRIRYRIDGQLIDIVKLPPDIHAAMVSRIKILAKLRLDETRVPQDGRFDVAFNDAQVDLRISVMPTVHGEKVVMRILEKSKGISSLESLGIEGLAYQNIIKAINKPYGICLATGPTGSGKSTTLYAILNRIATPNVNVVTLEDPIEYEIKGINQSQIRPKIGFTFADGLRSILRQDPNIIMVGEIRDGETATMATQASLTGHLVLSTLHTNDASGGIPRLTNMGIEPFLITSSLNVIMGQRLVRKICSNCKGEVTLPDGVREKITKDIEEIEVISPAEASRIKKPFTFYQGKGCVECNGKGYRGRIGIYEVLTMSDALEDLTLARASAADIQKQAQKEGMITMYQDGLLKVISGITTLDEVLRETSNK